jgi:glycosyltransferase involved in cell wall biosynthesis
MAGNRATTEPTTLNDHCGNRVSVVIPTYNYSHFILDAVKSVLAQDVSDLEIIIVDDGSTDNTYDVLTSYRDRVIYVYQENAGLSAARNNGIRRSTGEFILFLDSDDILGPSSLASQVRYLERNPSASVAVCKNKLFREQNRNGQPKPFGSWALYRKNLAVHLCYLNIAPPHAFIFRRQAIIETGWFDHKVDTCADYDFWLRAAVRGFVPHYNPSGSIYYRRHPESMSADLKNQHLHDAILHKRLSTLLDQYPLFPNGNRVDGLLAFSAGAILTSSRLLGHRLAGASELMQLAIKHIEEVNRLVNSGQGGWNVLTKLFYFRICEFLSNQCFRDFTEAQTIHENLRQILLRLNAPKSKIGLLSDGVKSRVMGSPELLLERKELTSLVWQYMRNSLFCRVSPG